MLLLSLDYPPNDGGISRLAAGLTKALLERNSAPRVLTFKSIGVGGLERPDVEYVEVSRKRGIREWQILRALNGYDKAAPILATLWNPEATVALIGGWKRVSILAHGNEVMTYVGKPLKQRLRRYILEKAHVVICNSRFTEGLVREVAPRSATAVVNPAVDADAFCPGISRSSARQKLGISIRARILLTVARLDRIKGHETVLRALALLTADERRDMLYVIVGKGEMRERLQDLALELGIGSQVHFAGFVADESLNLWYVAADLFLLCSVVDPLRRGMEGFGMALTEAQAAELPVVGTRSGGIPDAIKEGEGGWLIDEGDYLALAKHLRALSQDLKIFVDQGARGAERVRREMSWAAYADRICELI